MTDTVQANHEYLRFPFRFLGVLEFTLSNLSAA